MKIETSRFGTLDLAEDNIIHLPSGLFGFPDDKRYTLLEHKKGSPFVWLQSVDKGALAFVLIDPLLVTPDYEMQINPEDMKELQLTGRARRHPDLGHRQYYARREGSTHGQSPGAHRHQCEKEAGETDYSLRQPVFPPPSHPLQRNEIKPQFSMLNSQCQPSPSTSDGGRRMRDPGA